MKQLYFLFFSFFLSIAAQSQEVPDTVKKDTIVQPPRTDTPVLRLDTPVIQPRIQPRPRPDTIINRQRDTVIAADSISRDSLRIDDSLRTAIAAGLLTKKHVADSIAAEIASLKSERKIFHGQEDLFYYIIFMLLLFGSLRLLFEKYFYDLFRVFFRTTLKQRQISEQLLQSPLPSVFMNGYFGLSAGMYINFLLVYFNYSLHENFWMQYLYCIGGLSAIYLAKFLGLKLTGWVFNVSEATDSYVFIVFIINKMLGIFLIPFLVLLAFTKGDMYQVSLVLSWLGIGALIIYRFILSYAAVRNEIKLNPFHFILYLFAFEIIPLLLIYKLLLMIF
jgi:hypothetical protein